MALIAQLSDWHLLERDWLARGAEAIGRIAFLSSYRPLAVERRVARARAALAACRAARPDHVVITGDLTEDGSPGQWALVAELLLESGLDLSRITLVPGNHDAYPGKSAFAEALAGPLAQFAAASRIGEPVDLGDVLLLPVDSTLEQHYVRAAGRVGAPQRTRMDALAEDGRTLVVAQHHPPLPHSPPLLGWFQEITDLEASVGQLRRHERLHVLHGHVHRHRDLVVPGDRRPRVFSARATVEHDQPLRLYEADARGLRPRGDTDQLVG